MNMMFMKNESVFNITIDPYSDDDIKLYYNETFGFSPGVDILVGCNGSGKTTLLNRVEQKINYNSDDSMIAKVFKCCDTIGVVECMFTWGGSDNVGFGATILSSSEGERMALALRQAFDWMWAQCKKDSIKSVFLLLDSLDSGIDIPTLRMIRRVLNEVVTVVKQDFNTDLYVLVSANDYALVEGYRCLDVRTGEYIQFESWDDYADFCVKSDKHKQQAYSK